MSLATPVTLPCGLTLPNRLVKAAMAEDMAPTHVPGQQHLDAYIEWAAGDWGLILTGNVQVNPRFLGAPGDLQIPPAGEQARVDGAWRAYAAAAQKDGNAALVQLCHPGRQGPGFAGAASFFEKRVAPSPVALSLGTGLVARAAAALIFGTPRALSLAEIEGPGGVVAQFVDGAAFCQRVGFKGVQLHAAHGYLLAQFMSPKTNRRDDAYGGSAAKRVKIVVDIIRGVRAATGKDFAIGIKLNSVDASESESPEDTIEQVRLIAEAGIDMVEVSGGTYEDPKMFRTTAKSEKTPVKASTARREAFFLEFTQELRQHLPKLPLMVTGGFRTRLGMQDAVDSGACDFVGLARPAANQPRLPKETILNKSIPDDKASVELEAIEPPWLVKMIPISAVGVGFQSMYYGGKIQKMGKKEAASK